MTENSEPKDNDLELELAERLFELTKILEKHTIQIEEIKEKLEKEDPRIGEWNEKLEEWELGLGKRFEEINERITGFQGRFDNLTNEYGSLNDLISKETQQITSLEEKINDVGEQVSKLQGENTDQSQKITSLNEKTEEHTELISNLEEKSSDQTQKIDNLNQIQNDHEQILNDHTSEINARVPTTQFESALTEALEGLADKIISLKQTQEQIKTDLIDQGGRTQENIDSIISTLDIIGNGLETLDAMSQNQATAIEEQRESLGQFKHKLKELVSISKEDQKSHFENFSRLLESYNENIHTELTLTVESLKKSDIEILNEVGKHYMRKKVGANLEQKISDLVSELESEAKKTRDELVEGLEKTVKEYEDIMEEQTTRIKRQQQELERFQDDIQAVIDRKVNEKYEVVFSLLSKVAIHAEELALLIKASEIHIPRSLAEIELEIKKPELGDIPPEAPIIETEVSVEKKEDEIKSEETIRDTDETETLEESSPETLTTEEEPLVEDIEIVPEEDIDDQDYVDEDIQEDEFTDD